MIPQMPFVYDAPTAHRENDAEIAKTKSIVEPPKPEFGNKKLINTKCQDRLIDYCFREVLRTASAHETANAITFTRKKEMRICMRASLQLLLLYDFPQNESIVPDFAITGEGILFTNTKQSKGNESSGRGH